MSYLSSKNYVYWLFDGSCIDPITDGYIGITKNLKRRIREHMNKFHDFSLQILYEGTREECLYIEFGLRPRWNMGWNKSPGGRACSANGVFKGKKFTYEHRKKLSRSQLGRKVTERTKKAVAASNRRRIWTPEQRAKIAESNRRRVKK